MADLFLLTVSDLYARNGILADLHKTRLMQAYHPAIPAQWRIAGRTDDVAPENALSCST